MFKLKKQPYNSVLVSASSQKELSETFMRFQEHYESPFWAGKIFTIGQYKNWYCEKYGGDTYHLDWVGFNFPSKILDPFRNGFFDPLTSNEKKFLEFFKYRNDNFYIIGSNTKDVLKHELNHALYNYKTAYKNSINELLENNKNKIKKALDHLLKKGYHKKVLYDEVQAYVLDENYFKNYDIEIPIEIINKIKFLRKKYD